MALRDTSPPRFKCRNVETSKPDWAPDRHGDGKPRRRAAAPPVHPDLSLAECPIRADSFPHVFLMCSSCSSFFSFASTCFHMFPHLNHQQAAWHHEFAGIRSWWIEDSHAEARHCLFLGAISMAISYWCWRNGDHGDLDLKPRPLAWPNAHRNLSYVRSKRPNLKKDSSALKNEGNYSMLRPDFSALQTLVLSTLQTERFLSKEIYKYIYIYLFMCSYMYLFASFCNPEWPWPEW